MSTTTLLETSLMVASVAMPKGKSLTLEQNARVREAARKLVAKNDDNITATAAKLGLTQAGLSSFLSGRTGAGWQLATAVARAVGVSRDELVDGVDTIPEPPESHLPRFENLPGWAEAEAEARRRYGGKLDEKAFELARGASAASTPNPVTPDFVYDVALVLWKYHTEPATVARQQRKLDAQIKSDHTRAAKRMRPPPSNDTTPLKLTPPAPKPRRLKKGPRGDE